MNKLFQSSCGHCGRIELSESIPDACSACDLAALQINHKLLRAEQRHLMAQVAEWQAWAESTASVGLDQTDPDAVLPNEDRRILIRETCQDHVLIQAEGYQLIRNRDAAIFLLEEFNKIYTGSSDGRWIPQDALDSLKKILLG